MHSRVKEMEISLYYKKDIHFEKYNKHEYYFISEEAYINKF